MSLVSMIKGRGGPNGYGYASTAEEVTADLDLHGKTYVVTGVNSGLGAESAKVLARRGARIVGTARTLDKARAACAAVGEDAIPVACELSDPESVRACVETVRERTESLDGILANAGVMMLPQREVVHGVEKQLFVNHFGHFMLVTGLLDHLQDGGRVVMLSSGAHGWAPPEGIRLDDLACSQGYSPRTAYGQSKLANLLFARELGRRFAAEGRGRIANAVHPGVIDTELGRHLPWIARIVYPIASVLAMKSVAQGAATQCYVLARPLDANGEYFVDCNPAKSSRLGRDMDLAERLWSATEAHLATL
tara:strand:+ start:1414 stop:2334 length:921 start_codon:yes stop_codon:yes gene_type:complete